MFSVLCCLGKMLIRQLWEASRENDRSPEFPDIWITYWSLNCAGARPLITGPSHRIVSDLFRPWSLTNEKTVLRSRDPGVIGGNWPTRHLSPHPALSQLQQPSNIIIYVSLFTNLTSPLPHNSDLSDSHEYIEWQVLGEWICTRQSSRRISKDEADRSLFVDSIVCYDSAHQTY